MFWAPPVNRKWCVLLLYYALTLPNLFGYLSILLYRRFASNFGQKPLPKNEESLLPVNVRGSKTSLRKLANDELCWFDLPALAICFFPSPKSCVFWFAEFGLLMLLFTKSCLDTFGNFALKSKKKIKTTMVALNYRFFNLDTSLRSWRDRHVSAYRDRGGDIEKLPVPA